MNWNYHAARWVLGSLPAEEVPDLATQALMEGSESTDLTVLAGLSGPTWADIDARFRKVLVELNVPVPSHDQAVLVLARHVAEGIVAGRVEVDTGARQLANLARDLRQPVPEVDVFVGLESEISDFADQMRVRYYGSAYCTKVQDESRHAVVEAARALASGAVEQRNAADKMGGR